MFAVYNAVHPDAGPIAVLGVVVGRRSGGVRGFSCRGLGGPPLVLTRHPAKREDFFGFFVAMSYPLCNHSCLTLLAIGSAEEAI